MFVKHWTTTVVFDAFFTLQNNEMPWANRVEHCFLGDVGSHREAGVSGADRSTNARLAFH